MSHETSGTGIYCIGIIIGVRKIKVLQVGIYFEKALIDVDNFREWFICGTSKIN